ncbi:MAG: hypothetical protein JO117_01010 [Verrucomicrobia bacterium]|nr:hypothetical protein [Verrucomicrobiota bacterium]MBV9657725.1 hypothetical protein [Verrucomicrobiota bacterium]
MKAISITCIICGTFIFVAPMLYQFGSFALVAYALANTHLSPMNIAAPALEEGYRIGSFCFGLALVSVGIVFALLGRRVIATSVSRKDVVAPLAQPSNA